MPFAGVNLKDCLDHPMLTMSAVETSSEWSAPPAPAAFDATAGLVARLCERGPQALNDLELLTLLLADPVPDRAALAHARELLRRRGGLRALIGRNTGLGKTPGSSPGAIKKKRNALHRNATQFAMLRLSVAVELTRRALHESLQKGPALNSPHLVSQYLQLELGDSPHENFAVLYLDSQHRLICSEVLFRGTLTQTAVYPREVVKAALAHNAASVILAHNHPSGNPLPSQADTQLTRTLTSALSLVDIRVLDHFVIAAGAPATSFAQQGLL